MDVAGLVSSIITFIDFSWTIVQGTYSVYESASGATEDNVQINHVLQDLQKATEKISTTMTGKDEDEKDLLKLAYQCHGLSSKLAVTLQTLRTDKRSGLQSFNIMLRSLIKKKEVQEIRSQLGEYRQQIILRLSSISLEQARRTQEIQGTQLHQLQELVQRAKALPENHPVLDSLYFDDMYERVEKINDATDGTFDWLFANTETMAASPGTNMLAVQTGPRQSSNDDEFGPQEHTRGERVESLRQRLSHPKEQELLKRRECTKRLSTFIENGSGVFFLRGKPGSGKSTLMKYLVRGRGHQTVHQKLRKWAGQKKLACISIFFLLHGAPLQRSLEGFYRTLLFEILRHCPELAQDIFPESQAKRHIDSPYRSSFPLEILHEAWIRFISIRNHSSNRFCVFIDGLDELEGSSGDRYNLAQSLKQWGAESGDVKIVCSGRPNQEFNIIFDQASQRIDLQDLTQSDIRKILTKMFEGLRQGKTKITGEQFNDLIDTISEKSEGVILWAVLVGKNVEDEIIHEASFDRLISTIYELPQEVEKFFESMWQDIGRGTQREDHHRRMLRSIYYILTFPARTSWRSHRFDGPLAIYFSWLEDVLKDPQFPRNFQFIPVLSDEQLKSRADYVRTRMVLHTKHLVEVDEEQHRSECPGHRIRQCRFVHRSAQEFMESKLGPTSPGSSTNAHMLELYLRLRLMYEASTKHQGPVGDLDWLLKLPERAPFWNGQPQLKRRYQIPPNIMEKSCELMECRMSSSMVSSVNNDGNVATCSYPWHRIIHSCAHITRKSELRTTPFSFIHLAISHQQIDYVSRVIKTNTHQLNRDDKDLGLLTSAVDGPHSHELVALMLEEGADPDTMVEIHHSETEQPRVAPIWLLVYFSTANMLSEVIPHQTPKDVMKEKFLILEQFLRIGRGVNVTFLATSVVKNRDLATGFLWTPATKEDGAFLVDLAQLVRVAGPDNMERILDLLQTPQTSRLISMLELINRLLLPQFPWPALPLGAATTLHRRVTDEYLINTKWGILSAFDGEHEIKTDFYYYSV